MKIRSITYFCNPKYPLDEKVIQAAGEFLAKAKSAYEAAGYEVQTVRLATIPFPKLLGEKQINELPKLAEQLEKLIRPNRRWSSFSWTRVARIAAQLSGHTRSDCRLAKYFLQRRDGR